MSTKVSIEETELESDALKIWAAIQGGDGSGNGERSAVELLRRIRAEARKAGMIEAAAFVPMDLRRGNKYLRQDILAAAEKKEGEK